MPNLGSLTMGDIREIWGSEDDHFTPWLSENLILLSQILNMNLESVGQQIRVGRYKCDLLCRDTVGNSYVVIENQLEQFDHDHLGKALVYTAGLNARTVIWIAEDFTNEHRKTLDWLNENTHDCIQFFGVKLEVIQIDSLCAPKFNIIVKPNNWRPTTIRSDDYWDNFNDYLEGHGSSLDVLNWQYGPDYLGFYLGYGENNGEHPDYWIAAGRSNGFIAASFCINRALFPDIEQWFTNNQEHVDQRFSGEFEEEPQWPNNHPFIVVGVRQELDNQIEQDGEFEWLRERLEKLERLFKHGGEINFLEENQ
jgi:hypothetical protein